MSGTAWKTCSLRIPHSCSPCKNNDKQVGGGKWTLPRLFSCSKDADFLDNIVRQINRRIVNELVGSFYISISGNMKHTSTHYFFTQYFCSFFRFFCWSSGKWPNTCLPWVTLPRLDFAGTSHCVRIHFLGKPITVMICGLLKAFLMTISPLSLLFLYNGADLQPLQSLGLFLIPTQ